MIDMPVRDAVERYLCEIDVSQRTRDWYRYTLTPFVDYVGSNILVCDIEASHIRLFLNHRRESVGGHTVHAHYRGIRALFGYLELEYDDFASPIGWGKRKAVKPPRTPKHAPQVASESDIAALIDSIELNSWIDMRDKAVIGVLACTGMRREEVAQMTMSELDIHKRRIVTFGKGDQEREIPFAFNVSVWLFGYLVSKPYHPSDRIWLGCGGGRGGYSDLSGDGIYQMLVRRCERAGINRLNPHSFRHGWATAMLNAGADIAFIQAILGHSSPAITKAVYARWLPEGLSVIYDALWDEVESLEV